MPFYFLYGKSNIRRYGTNTINIIPGFTQVGRDMHFKRPNNTDIFQIAGNKGILKHNTNPPTNSTQNS